MYACLPACLTACLHVCQYDCLSVYLSVCLPAYLSVCLPVCRSACLLACLSACLSLCLPACLSVSLPACMSICLSACLPACPTACLCVCRSACLPVCLSVLQSRQQLTRVAAWSFCRFVLPVLGPLRHPQPVVSEQRTVPGALLRRPADHAPRLLQRRHQPRPLPPHQQGLPPHGARARPEVREALLASPEARRPS